MEHWDIGEGHVYAQHCWLHMTSTLRAHTPTCLVSESEQRGRREALPLWLLCDLRSFMPPFILSLVFSGLQMSWFCFTQCWTWRKAEHTAASLANHQLGLFPPLKWFDLYLFIQTGTPERVRHSVPPCHPDMWLLFELSPSLAVLHFKNTLR